MKRSLLLCCLLFTYAYNTLIAQSDNIHFASITSTPKSAKSFYRLGDQVITIKKQGEFSDQPFVFISLHHNETTASEAALDFIENNGGAMISIENNFQHNIDFELIDKKYSLDPNQIFTKKGRGLQAGIFKPQILSSLQRFAIFMLDEIPENKGVVSMHNHAGNETGITYYSTGILKKDAKDIYINPEMDVDDFFLTTDKSLFEQLKGKKYNVVLKNIARNRDDGSLAYYFGRINKPYVDLVTEFGHYEQQKTMITVLADLLK